MRIIKTLNDIELLKQASVVKKEVMEEVEEHFRNIYKDVGRPEGIRIKDFSLKECGIIVLLEAGDNVEDLEEIGLNREDRGLLGTIPEWVEEQELKECTLITICIVYNNEYALSIFAEKGIFSEEVENWINENI